MNVGLISSGEAVLGYCSSLGVRCVPVPLSRGRIPACPKMIRLLTCTAQPRGIAFVETSTSGRRSRAVRRRHWRGGESWTVPMAAKPTSVDAPTSPETSSPLDAAAGIGFAGLHHVGFLCENLDKSLEFYCGLLGLELNPARPADKLPYRGAWLWVGEGMIHLMELPNPDPPEGRPEHGGRDRHACLAVKSVPAIKKILDNAGIKYTMSQSGRVALFTRDPDSNALEFTQI